MFSLPFTSGYTATVIADLYGHSSQRQPQDGSAPLNGPSSGSTSWWRQVLLLLTSGVLTRPCVPLQLSYNLC